MISGMIRVQRLEKSFGPHQVLRGLSFSAQPARITGIAGPNASGKTTLIKCFLGLVIPDSGSIFIQGRSLERGGDYRECLGYVPQLPDFPPLLKISELLGMLEGLRRRQAQRKSELIDFFQLEEFLDEPFGQLSGGTKQKIAALIALMFDPPILILDEPTASLDPVSIVRFKELLKEEEARGKTILLASHSMTELDQLAGDLLYIMEGVAAYHGPIDQLKRNERELSLEKAITNLVSKHPVRFQEVLR